MVIGANAKFGEWSLPAEQLYIDFNTSKNGLTEKEASERIAQYGFNETAQKKKINIVFRFLSYFLNPLVIFLIIIGTFSYFLSSAISGIIIYLMVAASVCLTFYEEYTAQDAAEKLQKIVKSNATVVRGGEEKKIPIKLLIPGDIVHLVAGDMVPADCAIISCKDFYVNQASLTGESLPVEKSSKPSKTSAGIVELGNAAFFGSSVVSGSVYALVIKTGMNTQFGELSRRLAQPNAETAFDRGIRDYSILMLKFVALLAVVIFAINATLKHNIIEAFLFALAVAVGLTPEMLPVIVTANLSQGANNMAKKEVIIKRLSSIQNLGAMDVLCTDKTGTLTEDSIELVRHLNADGDEDEVTLELAFVNSFFQTGLRNPLDKAIIDHDAKIASKSVENYAKVDEIPFDFMRRRMSVVVRNNDKTLILTKGAPEGILPLCIKHATHGIEHSFDKKDLKNAMKIYEQLSADGFRVLALASKDIGSKEKYSASDEFNLVLQGFLAFLDPPKKTAKKSIAELMKRGIEVKILSGDNELVNRKIANEVGLPIKGVITGDEIETASDESLGVLVEKNTIFARVLPMQKERIIIALQRNRHVIGFLGDGINDSPALKTSDVGISVDSGVDVAKESADIILLRKSLHVLYEGVDEGRRTFANTMKYLRMGSSSNFGNMFSVLGASIFLPFLPMAPIQIIFNNFLYDMSQLGIPSDKVDEEELEKPAKWDLNNVKNFMIYIGPVSSLYDYLTFFTLFFVLGVQAAVFQAGWFIESIMTQTLVIYVIRTKKLPFVQSMPSRKFMVLTSLILAIALIVVATPLRVYFGFGELPMVYFPILVLFIITYLGLAQFVKAQLIKRKIIG
ncbi:MAG: magnesium-translocating P-type ATPase [Candidatus Aenigmatarchaeota archaeon]